MSGKRANREGSYKKLPSGKWQGQVMVGYKPDGKRNIKTFTRPTKTEVRSLIADCLEQARVEEEAAEAARNPESYFDTWADIWYADHRTQVEKSTYWNYAYTLKILKAYFGHTPLQDIKVLNLNQFLDFLMDQGKARSSIAKCRSMLYQIFAAAEDNELITKNPAEHTKTIRKARAPQSKIPFTLEEISLIKNHLHNDLIGNSIMTLIGTGLRVQELLALTKDDISEDGSLVTVTRP